MVLAAVAVGVSAAGAVAGASAAEDAEDQQHAANQNSAQAAADAKSLGNRELDFNIRQYDEGRVLRDQAAQTSIDVSRAQLASQQQNDALAQEYADYNRTTFRPLEQGIVADAAGYDTAGRRAGAVAEATADVERGFGQAQRGLQRTLARTGVAPSNGGRAGSLMQDAALSKAKAIAGATTGAVRNVETQGFARRLDAASLGRNLPSSQATSAGIAINAGNSAVNNAGAAVNAQQAGIQNVNAGYAGAINAQYGAGRLYGQVADSNQSAANGYSSALGSLGRVAGGYAGRFGMPSFGTVDFGLGSSAFGATNGLGGQTYGDQVVNNPSAYIGSDENTKTGTGKRANTATMLAQIERTPVDRDWKYDPANGGKDDGGMPHDGPMAQRVQETMGDDVAPGGKVIDIASMNGRLMAGVQELSKQNKQLNKRMTRMESRVAK